MPKVKVFKPSQRYRLTKEYHRENWPLKYDANDRRELQLELNL